jgi:LmbE family N-acetylglucosaminyl deacetylase
MKILALGPHPDDIEIGCGGNLIKYVDGGHELYMMVMTFGDKGGNRDIRKSEQLKAAEIMGVKDLIWGGYEDTQLTPNMNQLVMDIETILKKIRPDFFFVVYGDDSHQDHRALSKAAVSASRYIKNVLFYEVPTSQNYAPTVFVDIRSTVDRKIKALMAHESQVMKTNIEGLNIADIARSTAVFRGIQGRVGMAEGFVPLRLFVNI